MVRSSVFPLWNLCLAQGHGPFLPCFLVKIIFCVSDLDHGLSRTDLWVVVVQRSEFTVLQTNTLWGQQHLVLLY